MKRCIHESGRYLFMCLVSINQDGGKPVFGKLAFLKGFRSRVFFSVYIFSHQSFLSVTNSIDTAYILL